MHACVRIFGVCQKECLPFKEIDSVPHPLWASGCTFVGHCVRQPVAQRKGRQCWYAGCSHPVGHQWCACSRQALVKMQWSSRSVYFQLSAVFMHLVDYYFFAWSEHLDAGLGWSFKFKCTVLQ